jgi:hypothetical protein
MVLTFWKLRSCSLSIGVALWMTFTPSLPAYAQSQDAGAPGAGPTTQSSASPSQDSKKGEDSSSADPNGATDSGAPPPSMINAIGSASPLGSPNGSLRWGDFFVSDVSFTQIYDVSNYSGQSLTNSSGSSFSDSTSLFETTLAFDHRSRNNEIALQFQPRLAIVDGNVFPDYSNQNVNFNWVLNQDSRWSAVFRDNFSYLSSQNLYGTNFTDVNAQTGTTVQNNFLDGPGAFLSESAGLTVSYRWTPRTTVSFIPQFQYTRSTATKSGTSIGRDYGGAVTIGYQLSARQTIGATFSGQYVATSGLSLGNSQYYSAGLNYSRQIGAFWTVSGYLAATRTSGGGISQPFTYSATASLTRALRRGSVGVVYSRDLAIGYVTNQFADRIDAVANLQVVRNLTLSISGGYQTETQSNSPISAYYTVNQITYRLAPRVSSFVSYGYRLQNGDSLRVLTGHRNFVSGGIRWDSGPRAAY